MPAPVLIGPQPSTPGLISSAQSRTREIPQDLLMEASHRLGIMALMAFVLWIVANVLWRATFPAFHPGVKAPPLGIPDLIVVVSAAASLALWIFIRRSHRSPEFFLNLGLAYLVITCFSVALVMHWGLPTVQHLEPMISWVGVVILMFAAVLPVDPRKMLAAGLVGAAMSPVAMAITNVHGLGVADAAKIGMLMHYPDFLLAGI